MPTGKRTRSKASKTVSDSRRPATPPPPQRPLPESDPDKKPFTPEVLDRTVIAIPLLDKLKAEREALKNDPGATRELHPVIIDVHLEYPGGRDAARERVQELVSKIIDRMGKSSSLVDPKQGINQGKTKLSGQYLFGKLEAAVIEELVRQDRTPEGKKGSVRAKPSIYRIWPDFAVKALINKSVSTVKADAALNSFATTGDKIVWAVMDSGIDVLHPHFEKYDNLNLAGVPPIAHRDFTATDGSDIGALVDKFGHGTHVAGIIAGTMSAEDGEIVAVTRYRDEQGNIKRQADPLPRIAGMAPKCTLLSLKVLDENGEGEASNLIAAIEEVQRINGYGRYIRVHGVNMSVGYDFEPEWFACGQSPLCVEVDRLVKSGVVVVVAAGNTGYGFAQTQARGAVSAGLGLTINDPGNADLAVTVGSTHRDMPHVYGVSYFSSKGPTGDGRAKPDIVAPGEKIISCDSGWRVEEDNDSTPPLPPEKAHMDQVKARIAQWNAGKGPESKKQSSKRSKALYREDSGTSMAAPHVAGVIAAFLSVRREFIGRPEKVKEIFLSMATDLKRERYFQGCGLVDLMRAIQSV